MEIRLGSLAPQTTSARESYESREWKPRINIAIGCKNSKYCVRLWDLISVNSRY